ncbi:DUF1036 domain-containing protein [Microcoleus sp. B4-C5]|uniref:DUF1036 domain-containing protein n=1 Tax=unclassified Microcoleus TaxID=2642155 RepID=UPI002FD08E65
MKINNFRTSLATFVLGSATLAVGMFSFSPPAQAWFKVCNKSGSTATVAFAYPEGGGWTSHGWYRLKSGECATTYHPSLKNRFYYVYGVSESGGQWGGNHRFCTVESEFTMASSDRRCGSNGEWKGFEQVDTGNAKNFTYTLTE